MHVLKNTLTAIVLTGFLVSCGSKQVAISADTQKSTLNNVASMTVTEIKDKGGKYDIGLTISNESQDPIIIMLKDMSCSKGNIAGELKHTFFNTGERTIDFGSKQSKNFRLVCKLGGKTEGGYKLQIARVYANPTGDGKTTGKVIGKDLVWTQAAAVK